MELDSSDDNADFLSECAFDGFVDGKIIVCDIFAFSFGIILFNSVLLILFTQNYFDSSVRVSS